MYLREIKKDITYFRKTFVRADSQVNISGLNVVNAATKIIEVAKNIDTRKQVIIVPAKPVAL